jgi:hypothetical protein
MQTINKKNPVYHTNLEQRSAEWFKIRLGRFTSSNIFKLMTEPRSKAAKGNGELSATAKTYIEEKAAEIIYNSPAPFFTNSAMDWGTENEQTAIDAYKNITGVDVVPVGFVTVGDHTGTSPDGLINTSEPAGLIEVQCPYNRVNHLQNVLTLKTGDDLKKHSKQYYYQVQHQLYITGRVYCDFVSFDPRLLEGDNWRLCCHIVRVNADPDVFNKFDEKLNKAAEYLNIIADQLKNAE